MEDQIWSAFMSSDKNVFSDLINKNKNNLNNLK